MRENEICQSCGIELYNEVLGTNVDGSSSFTYCMYCYEDGNFTEELTLEEAVNRIVEANTDEDISKEQAYEFAKEFLPKLMRWKV